MEKYEIEIVFHFSGLIIDYIQQAFIVYDLFQYDYIK